MAAVYILLLAFSAAFAAWASLRISRRLEVMLGTSVIPAGLFAVLSAIGFLIIVAMPSPVAVAALLLVLQSSYSVRHPMPVYAQFGVPLIAVLMGLSALHLPAITGLPTWALYAGAAALWLLTTLMASRLPDTPREGSLAMSFILFPLAASSLFGETPVFLALDALLLLAPLAGIVFARQSSSTLGLPCRQPYGFILGWMLVVALAHHAYVGAGLSIGFYLAVVLVGLVRKPSASFDASAL